jgi:hypothetical protein
MDYTQDGTFVGYFRTPGQAFSTDYQIQVFEFSTSQKQQLNKEAIAGTINLADSPGLLSYFVVAFPEPRNLSGVYFNSQLPGFGSTRPVTVEYSTSSTNGVDGAWDAVGTITRSSDWTGGTTDASYRTSILNLALSNVTSLRVACQGGGSSVPTEVSRFHLYGTSSLTAGRLRLWHPTSDVEVPGSYLDWGDTPRGSSGDKAFRIKNTSTSLTASNVTVQFYASSSDASPSSVYQHYVSDDGLAFRGLIKIPSIGPGQLAGPYYVRRVTPSNASLTLPLVVEVGLEGTWI